MNFYKSLSLERVIEKIAFIYWFLVVLKTIFIFLFFSDSPAIGSGFNIFISGLFFIILASLVPINSRSRKLYFPLPAKGIVFYFLWALLSLVWSVTGSVLVAATYWLGGVFDVLVVILLFYLGDSKIILRASFKGFSIGALTLIVLANLVLGDMGDGRLGGDLVHPNALGRQLAVAGICCFYIILNKEKENKEGFWYFVFAGIVVGLISTLSKTAIVSFFLSFFIIILMSKNKGTKFLPIFLIFGVVIIGMFSIIQDYLNAYVSETPDGSETLSGRTLLWDECWEMIQNAWALGYGLMSFRDIGPDIFSVRLAHAHNDFIMQWFSLGIVGVILAIFIYSASISFFWKNKKSIEDWRIYRSHIGFSLVIFFLIRGITEADALWIVFPPPLLMMFLLDSRVKNHNYYKN